MNRNNWKCGFFSKVCLILVYISFYLVQLNVYAHQASQDSFFPGNNGIHYSYKGFNGSWKKEARNQSQKNSFRLNKRFHPEYLFIAPKALNDSVKNIFGIQTVLLNEAQPLSNYTFNSPSLRGPPAIG
jgi:hypothetical protein